MRTRNFETADSAMKSALKIWSRLAMNVSILTGFALLLNLVSNRAAAQNVTRPPAADTDFFLACSAQNFMKLNSQPVVESKFSLASKRANLQTELGGSAASEFVQPTEGEHALFSSGDITLRRQLLNFSSRSEITAAETNVKATEAGLNAALLDHLLRTNAQWLDLAGLIIEREMIKEQIVELEALNEFASRLMKGRLIDPGDGLLVKENLLRFQLRKSEVDQAVSVSQSKLEVDSGFKVVSFDDRIFKTMLAVPVTRWDQIEAKLADLPKQVSAAQRSVALTQELKAIDRAWYPALSGELGARQPVGAPSVPGGPPELFAGLSLTFRLQNETMEAGRQRIQSLQAIEAERGRRAEVEYRSIVRDRKERASYLQVQANLAAERKANLERLRALQETKFRSGKLSFLVLNDVMLSLLEARRQVSSIRAQLVSLDRDRKIFLFFADLRVEGFGSCQSK